MKTLTMGSLFDGIGGFPLAAVHNGIVPVWASEIEKAPVSITRRHFPDMAHLGDITKLDGGAIPPVHILTFGSPCQNLSQIGRREGLTGAKSSLFFQAIRIISEMREATNHLFPVITVWENVMGAFSSNDRMDFRAVLSAFTDAEVPMPPSGRWGPRKYYLSPTQCAHFLKLAQIAGFPPPPEIEALCLSQGGAYPSSDPFNATGCGQPQKNDPERRSKTVLDYQLTLFPLF